MFVLWQATADPAAPSRARSACGSVRANAGDTGCAVGPEGCPSSPGDVDDLPTVLEFDPGSFVLTAFGRSNAGTVRGDAAVADRFLNLFFRI